MTRFVDKFEWQTILLAIDDMQCLISNISDDELQSDWFDMHNILDIIAGMIVSKKIYSEHQKDTVIEIMTHIIRAVGVLQDDKFDDLCLDRYQIIDVATSLLLWLHFEVIWVESGDEKNFYFN